MSRVLVTGASGFIGRAAVAALRARAYEVHGVARSPAADVEADAWHSVDLLDPSAVNALVRDAAASHLLHLAWTTAHGRFWADADNLAWARATCALVEAFAAAGGRRAVMAGSCAQYDWNADVVGPSGFVFEVRTARRPHTLYGRAKQSTSELLDVWSSEVGLSYATGLVFFPYGPYDKPDRLVPAVTRDLVAGDEARVSAGTQVRDFIHVADVGSALAGLVDSDVRGDVNVGSGRGASVAEIAMTVAEILGREQLLRLGAIAATDEAPAVVADVTRLRDEVGFAHRYDLESGLRDAVEWWRDWTVSASGAGTRLAKP